MSNVPLKDVRIVGVGAHDEPETSDLAAAESLVRLIPVGNSPLDDAERAHLVAAIDARRAAVARVRKIEVDEFELPAFVWSDRRR
jgi:hypothetical protein